MFIVSVMNHDMYLICICPTLFSFVCVCCCSLSSEHYLFSAFSGNTVANTVSLYDAIPTFKIFLANYSSQR